MHVIPRSQDKGVDLLATFALADTFHLRLGGQAKRYRPDSPVGVSVVDQLAAGIEAEQITRGWVATSGGFSDEGVERKAAGGRP